MKRYQIPTERTPWAGTTLPELIEAGLISAPAELHGRYRGEVYRAVLRPDGTIEYAGDIYKSPSIAAAHIRLAVMGPREGRPYPPTNGWAFWSMAKDDGERIPLDNLRQTLYRTRAG